MMCGDGWLVNGVWWCVVNVEVNVLCVWDVR